MPIEKWTWEIPAGSTDGEKPLKAAMRELQEETGYKAKYWKLLNEIYLTPALGNNKTSVFKADGLTQTLDNIKDQEGIIDVKAFSLVEIKDMIHDGDIMDAPTIAAIYLYENDDV